MSVYTVIFYVLAAVTLIATVLAITSRNRVHALAYLVASFLATALLFYLLGAPLPAVLEVIVYAGAIMVFFLFVVITIRSESSERRLSRYALRWFYPVVVTAISLILGFAMGLETPDMGRALSAAVAPPRVFGKALFEVYWFPVEIASLLLFVGLVGALYLGRGRKGAKNRQGGRL
jgi:NADH-quinone oxidoreductase subunit J